MSWPFIRSQTMSGNFRRLLIAHDNIIINIKLIALFAEASMTSWKSRTVDGNFFGFNLQPRTETFLEKPLKINCSHSEIPLQSRDGGLPMSRLCFHVYSHALNKQSRRLCVCESLTASPHSDVCVLSPQLTVSSLLHCRLAAITSLQV